MDKLFAPVIDYPVAAILLCLSLCSIAAAGLGGLKLNASYTAYFDQQDPILTKHRDIQRRFSISDGFVVVLQFKNAAALDASSVEQLHNVVQALEKLEFVDSTSSIFDIRLSEDAELAEFEFDLLELDEQESAAHKSPVPIIDRETVNKDPRGSGLLIGKNDKALAVEVAVNLPSSLPAPALIATMAEIRSAVSEALNEADEQITVRYSGPLLLNEAYVSVIKHDLLVFLPVLILTIGLMLSWVFGSWKIAGLVFLIAALAIISGFGLAGWLSFELAAIVAFAPVIIASIAVAGCVHMLNAYRFHLAQGDGRREAIIGALNDNFLPLALTSLTTAGGFLALSFSPSPPVRTIGYIVAIGVASAWWLIVIALPALLICSNSIPTGQPPFERLLAHIVRPAQQRPTLVLAIFALIGLLLIPQLGKNQINDNVFDYFPSSHPFQRDAKFLEQAMSGVNPSVFSVDSLVPFGALEREFVAAVTTLQAHLDDQPEVRKTLGVSSFAAIMAAPNDADGIDMTRYKALAKIHTPVGLGIQRLVDANYQRIAIHAYTDSLDAKAQIEFDNHVTTWFETRYPQFRISSGGTSKVFAHLGQRNALSMIKALLIALGVISFICIFVIKNIHGVWIGFFCNLFPIVVVYAVWALIDGNISIGGAVVIGMILGIVVDDTLYLLAAFRSAKADNQSEPVRQAIAKVGPAILATSVTLILGLSAGLLSDFAPIKTMSGLSMAVIFVAVVTDLMVLSIILNKLSGRERNRHQN